LKRVSKINGIIQRIGRKNFKDIKYEE